MTTHEQSKIQHVVRPIWDAWMRFGTHHVPYINSENILEENSNPGSEQPVEDS
ncbi:MAG: hypothetical protein OXG88_06620 [Gammaproteobacteria bacterium]|nr:hypothetical protein [Gammaproteobacteria bacterium]